MLPRFPPPSTTRLLLLLPRRQLATAATTNKSATPPPTTTNKKTGDSPPPPRFTRADTVRLTEQLHKRERAVHDLRTRLVRDGVAPNVLTTPPPITRRANRAATAPRYRHPKITTTPFHTPTNNSNRLARIARTSKQASEDAKKLKEEQDRNVHALALDLLNNWNGTALPSDFLTSPESLNAAFQPVLPKRHAPSVKLFAEEIKNLETLYGPLPEAAEECDPRQGQLLVCVQDYQSGRIGVSQTVDFFKTWADTNGAMWITVPPSEMWDNGTITPEHLVATMLKDAGLEENDAAWTLRGDGDEDKHKFLVAFSSKKAFKKFASHHGGGTSSLH